jgi:hypothetical protein
MIEKIREMAKAQYRKRGIAYFFARTALGDWRYPLLCAFSSFQLCRASLLNRPIIHVIGDSHVTPFEFQNGFIAHHIGQATAHNLIKENNTSNSREILLKVVSNINPKRDALLLVFGEIDARIHIHNQHMKTGKTIDELINATVSNYGKAILELSSKGFRVAVLGIPPAGSQENIYKYPFYGSREERKAISIAFNRALGAWCASIRVPFIDVQKTASGSDGFLSGEFARDEIHLNSRIVPYVRSSLIKAFSVGI